MNEEFIIKFMTKKEFADMCLNLKIEIPKEYLPVVEKAKNDEVLGIKMVRLSSMETKVIEVKLINEEEFTRMLRSFSNV